jgi:hypothetical protein
MSPEQIIIGILTIWLLIISFLFYKLYSHYTHLTADVSKKDLISSLNHLISQSTENSEELVKLSEKLSKEIIENKKHLQRIGFSRYNPFTDTGGDQSFTTALLDENGNGIVISSLHSRENTRLYAKKVVSGKVENQATSAEELSVIKDALNSHAK